jgi:uncharacterized short protein YbdD (DUF466 family)
MKATLFLAFLVLLTYAGFAQASHPASGQPVPQVQVADFQTLQNRVDSLERQVADLRSRHDWLMQAEGIVASLVGALGIVLTVLTFLWAIRPSRQAVGRLKKFMKDTQSRMTESALRTGKSAFVMNYGLAVRDPVNGMSEMIGTILYMMNSGVNVVDVKEQFDQILNILAGVRDQDKLEALQEKEPNLETLQDYLKECKHTRYLRRIESTLRSKK